MAEFSRRHLLQLGAALLAQPGVVAAGRSDWSAALDLPHFDRQFLHEYALAFSSAFPAEADVAVLRELLLGGPAPVTADSLARAIRAEFRRFDTVTVNGWLLSRTEARLLYLTAQV